MNNWFLRNKFGILLAISMLVWGGSWPAGKILSTYGSSNEIVFTRFWIVAISFLPILIFTSPNWNNLFKLKKFLLYASILLVGYNFAFIIGLNIGKSGAGGVLVTSLNPLIAFGIQSLVTKKSLRFNEKIGLFIGLIAGVLLLEIWKLKDHFFDLSTLCFLICALSWALLSRCTSRTNGIPDALGFSFLLYLSTSMILASTINFTSYHQMILKADLQFWYLILYNGIISTTIATTIYFYATSKLGSAQSSSFIFLVPSSAAFFSYIFMNEMISLSMISGGVLGIIAIYFINKRAS